MQVCRYLSQTGSGNELLFFGIQSGTGNFIGKEVVPSFERRYGFCRLWLSLLVSFFLLSSSSYSFDSNSTNYLNLTPRSHDCVDGSYLTFSEELIEGLTYVVPIQFYNRYSDPITARSANVVCNCIVAKFEEKVVQPGDSFACYLYIRPKKGDMLQVVSVRGEKGAGMDQELVRIKIDSKTIQPITLLPDEVVVNSKSQLLSKDFAEVRLAEGIEIMSCEFNDTHSPVKLDFVNKESKMIFAPQAGFGTFFAESNAEHRLSIDFRFKFKGVSGISQKEIAFSSEKAIRFTPSTIIPRHSNDSIKFRFLVSNSPLASDQIKSARFECSGHDNNWKAIAASLSIRRVAATKFLIDVNVDDYKSFAKSDRYRLVLTEPNSNEGVPIVLDIPIHVGHVGETNE